jgi:hypothetical protein
MAAGDFDVRTLSAARIDGGGRNINGQPKNNKTRIVVSITGTYATGGVTLKASDLGLETIDAIFSGANTFVSADTAPAAGAPNRVAYAARSGSEGLLILNTSASTQAQSAQTAFSTTLVVFGDSAEGPELT